MRHYAAFTILATAAVLFACTEEFPVVVEVDENTKGGVIELELTKSSADVVGQTVMLSVTVRAGPNKVPLLNARVNWTVNGGSIAPKSERTNASGVAEAEWQLGTTPGEFKAEAHVGLLMAEEIVHVKADVPDKIIVNNTSSAFTGIAGEALPEMLVVKVTDKFENPVAGREVTFSASGNGSVNPSTANTDAAGLAKTTWTLDTVPGSQTSSASVSGKSVSFTADGRVGPPAVLEPISGNGQTGDVGRALPLPIVVEVKDRFGNPRAGDTIRFLTAEPNNHGTASPEKVSTGQDGRAQTTWTLGQLFSLQQRLTAQVMGTGVSTDFAATARSVVTIDVVSGNAQTGTVNQDLPMPIRVLVRDADGEIRAGIAVTFDANSSGSFNPATALTDQHGIVETSWRLGTTAGDQTASVRAGAQSKSLTATATAGPGKTLSYVSGGGNGEVGLLLPQPLIARVVDEFGNRKAGHTVNWAVTAGGGDVNPMSSQTNADGHAQTSWKLGSTPNVTQTATASAEGLAGSPVNYTAIGTVGSVANLEILSGNMQSGVVNQPLAQDLIVRATDALNNPISNATVTFVSASGSLTQSSTVTNANGEAQSEWTLGRTSGAQTATASAGAKTAQFTATAAPDVPANVAKVSGDNQDARVGTALALPLVVRVTDQFGNSNPSVTVTFATATGSVNPATRTTDASGMASTTWTLGTDATVPQTATATVTGLPSVTFNATAVTGTSVITIVSGNSQTGTVNQALALPLVVRVTDALNNIKAGETVTFSPSLSDGTPAPPSAVTGADGLAQTVWTLGTIARAQSLTVSTAGAESKTFTATGTPDDAENIQYISGTGQEGPVGQALPLPLKVRVRDQFNNAKAGVTVTFATSNGSVAPPNVATDANGEAATTWTLGTVPGPQSVTATAPAIPGVQVVFNATALVGPPSSMLAHEGNGQSATVGTAVAVDPAVIIKDSFGNPVSGVSVTFTVTGGGGSVAGSPAVTGADGVARITSWTLGNTAGANTVDATAAGLTTVTFNATGTAGPASSMALHEGNGQSATVGAAVAIDPAVIVKDAFGNPVSGVSVTFTVTGGGGSVAGSPATSGADGVARITSWTLGNTAGSNSINATATGLATVTFNATGTAGAASTMTLHEGDGQSATVGTAVATDPAVIIKDAFGNPKSGVSVTFTVTGGGGSVAGSPAVSGADGVARITSWTLGNTPGANTLDATSAGLSTVTFNATATVGAASTMTLHEGDGQSATVGTAVATAPAVIIKDALGNPVSGVSVTFTVTGGGGSVTGSPAVSGADGVARITSWTLGNTAGANSLDATAAGLGTVTFTATGTAGAASTMTLHEGNDQSATVNTAVATAPAVIVKDAFGNPVSGVSVTFTVTGGGGSVAGSPAVSGTDGVARITSWTLGGTAGANSLDATATGLGTVTFTATGTAEDPVTVIQSSPVVFATRLTQAFVRPTAVLN